MLPFLVEKKKEKELLVGIKSRIDLASLRIHLKFSWHLSNVKMSARKIYIRFGGFCSLYKICRASVTPLPTGVLGPHGTHCQQAPDPARTNLVFLAASRRQADIFLTQHHQAASSWACSGFRKTSKLEKSSYNLKKILASWTKSELGVDFLMGIEWWDEPIFLQYLLV